MNAKYLLVLSLACYLSLSGSHAGPLDLGASVSKTPYDPYLGPMWAVLRGLRGSQPDLAVVEKLVREGRAFRYVYKNDEPYVPQLPDVTEATKGGDCKAKALWLASKMGSKKVRYVIGKAKLVSNISHAWLIWEGPEGWLILDATNYSRPLFPQRLSPSEFIPTYSYSPAGRYAHTVSAAGRGAKDGDHL
jgi:hypothetical protein